MSIEHALKQMIRDVVMECIAEVASPSEPELITVAEVAEMCGGCDESVILALIRDAESNGFPSVRLGKRKILIDRNRLLVWLNQGGLDSNGVHQEDRRRQVQGPSLKAVPRAA